MTNLTIPRNDEHTDPYIPRTSPAQLLHSCEQCGTLHPVFPSELKRGRGLFCCLSCARGNWRTKPSKKICITCGNTFYTRLDRSTCSETCRTNLITGNTTIGTK